MVKLTKTKLNKKLEKFYLLLTFFAVISAGSAIAQTSTSVTTSSKKTTIITAPKPETFPTATPVPAVRPKTIPFPPSRRIVSAGNVNVNKSGIPAEKFIKVDEKADIDFCVNNGNLKINGWDRNEVRAMVEDGSYVDFKVRNKNGQNQPMALTVVGYDIKQTTFPGANICLSGENIELDVPRGASVTVKGNQYEAEISSVNKADVRNVGGNIILNDIFQKTFAKTFEGNLRIENSGGEITLNNSNGDIFAFNAKPIEFSNIFTAKTNNGTIKLQSVDYSQIITKSSSGTIDFTGSILSGGQYSFDTQNGSIFLKLPQKTSSEVRATYGLGSFQTDLTMTNVVKSPGQPQRLTGRIGSGDATLNINTFNGSISIKTTEQ